MTKRGDAARARRSLDGLFGADKLGQAKPPRVGGDRWSNAPNQDERRAASKKAVERQKQQKAAKREGERKSSRSGKNKPRKGFF